MDLISTEHVLPEWFNPFLNSLKSMINEVADAVIALDHKYAALEGGLAVQKKITDALVDDKNRVEKKLYEVETALEEQLQYSRRNCLVIHGVEESNERENTDNIVLNLCDKMDVGISKI